MDPEQAMLIGGKRLSLCVPGERRWRDATSEVGRLPVKLYLLDLGNGATA